MAKSLISVKITDAVALLFELILVKCSRGQEQHYLQKPAPSAKPSRQNLPEKPTK